MLLSLVDGTMMKRFSEFLPIAKSALSKVWGIADRILTIAWELFCWSIIPLVFGYLCYISISNQFEISWLHICLAGIAVSPWILRILARYFSEFNIGPKGFSGKIRETVKNKDEIEPIVFMANEQKQESEFSKLGPEAKKVLRTLWKYQVECFGPDDIRRWGFAVGHAAPDYAEFRVGMFQLDDKGFTAMDKRGFIFLTNNGVSFCKANNQEIANHPFFYSNFSN